MKKKALGALLVLALLGAVATAVLLLIPAKPGYEVTFFLTSDLHYGVSPTVAAANAETVDAMNALPGGT